MKIEECCLQSFLLLRKKFRDVIKMFLFGNKQNTPRLELTF